MKSRKAALALVLLIAAVVGSATVVSASPKVDPALSSRLKTAMATDLFGVILTFNGDRVNEVQLAQVSSLGITSGYRMNKLPIVAVNANPSQIMQMANWSSLRSIYLNAPVELYMHQSKPLIGVNRLRTDAEHHSTQWRPSNFRQGRHRRHQRHRR